MKGIVMGIAPSMMSDSTIESLVEAHGLKGYEARQYVQNIKAVRSNELQKNPLTPHQRKLVEQSYRKPKPLHRKLKRAHRTSFEQNNAFIIDLMNMSDNELNAYAYAFGKQAELSESQTKMKIKQLKEKGNKFMTSTDLLQELRNKQAQNVGMDVKQAVGEFYKEKFLEDYSMSFEAKQALEVDNEGFFPKKMMERIVLDYPTDNPLREIMTVTSEKRLLEVAVVKYSGDEELKLEADAVTFQPNHDRIPVKVSESVVLGTDTNLVETIELAMSSELLTREINNIFAEEPAPNKRHMSLYHNGIEIVTGESIYAAVDKALSDLPRAIRNNASVVMSLEDYKEVVKHLGSLGLGGLASNPNMIWNKKIVIMDEAVKPVVGDFELLHTNYERIGMSVGKDVSDGIYTFALPIVMDTRVLLPKAFRIAEAE